MSPRRWRVRKTTEPTKIVCWWDIDLKIGQYKKSKVRARPLIELERRLGHRLYVRDVGPAYGKADTWKFDAYNYLDTTDPAQAAHFVLNQLMCVSTSVSSSWIKFNGTPTIENGDWDEATVCALYWGPPTQIGLDHYDSAGVLLHLADSSYRDDREFCRKTPLISVPENPTRADYLVEYKIHIVCGNRQKLMEYHWPRFVAARFPDGIELFDVDGKSHNGIPNVIRARKVLKDVTEQAAVAHCIALEAGFHISFSPDPEFKVSARQPNAPEGIIELTMTRDSAGLA